MNPVEKYLDKPATERLYSEGLTLFQQYGLNAFPKAWQKLSPGPFGRNKDELEAILRKVAPLVPAGHATSYPAPQAIKAEVLPPPPTREEVADIEYGIIKQIRQKRQERMQHSQSFHDCKSDSERALVCDQIDLVNEELKRLNGELAYVKRYGKKPPEPEQDVFLLPENDKELATMKQRLQSRILKVEKRIDFLEDLPEKDKRRAKLPEQFNKLRDLQTRVELIVEKRKKLKDGK